MIFRMESAYPRPLDMSYANFGRQSRLQHAPLGAFSQSLPRVCSYIVAVHWKESYTKPSLAVGGELNSLFAERSLTRER